jgi:hypothetical protein
MALFPNNKVVPVYYVTFTLASVSAGAIVYFEFDCMSFEHMCLFVIGCVVTFAGVFMTASKSETQAQVHSSSTWGTAVSTRPRRDLQRNDTVGPIEWPFWLTVVVEWYDSSRWTLIFVDATLCH